ncbi:MAG: ABC transporter ATP-binding protein [Pseudomonadota bacterium]
MTPLLSITGAAKYYQSGESMVRALDGVSLDIHAGELVAIMGPSGSGKSTFLLIAGLIDKPTRGEVSFAGRPMSSPEADLDKLRDFRRRNIGFVFQRPNLIPFLTAAENVALAMEMDDVAPDDAHAHAVTLLEALDLGHRIANRPAKLSGGEQQRVSIARALANDPRLILADEPTASLDSVRGRQAVTVLRRIADERGTAVAVVTHDARYLDLFDRVIAFEDGRIVSADQPMQLGAA